MDTNPKVICRVESKAKIALALVPRFHPIEFPTFYFGLELFKKIELGDSIRKGLAVAVIFAYAKGPHCFFLAVNFHPPFPSNPFLVPFGRAICHAKQMQK